MLQDLMERCVTREEAEHMDENELEGKIVTGDFYGG
jgi:hypothetical protein